MTLSEIATLCPPPEGMEWHGRVAGASFEYEARRTSSVWVNLRGDATQDDDACGWYVTVTACYLNMSVTTGGFLPDLPAAYFRALQAVGLAPDAEKARLREGLASLNVAHDVAVKHIGKLASENADFRRRLTWTSEVPTEPGSYLVRWAETRGRPVVWTFDAGVWYGPSGSVCRPPPLGSSFLNVADLKETR